MRNCLIIIFTSIVLIFSTLISLEIFLRIFNIRPKVFLVRTSYVRFSDNKILAYELNPEDEVINSYGLRNQEIEIHKPKQTFRLIALGDSITFGCCANPPSKAYPSFLQEIISSPDPEKPNIEVINAGIVGYNTEQEAEFYKVKLKKLDPDFLILQVTLNDWNKKAFQYDFLLDQQNEDERKVSSTFFSSTDGNRFLWKSYIFQHINYLFAAKETLSKQETYNNDEIGIMDTNTNQPVPPWEETNIIRNGFENLSNMLSAEEKNKVLVVLFPDFANDPTDYPPELLQEHLYIAHEAEKQGFKFLDLKNCFEKDYEINHKLFIGENYDNVHPTEYGHEVAAHCISDILKRDFNF